MIHKENYYSIPVMMSRYVNDLIEIQNLLIHFNNIPLLIFQEIIMPREFRTVSNNIPTSSKAIQNGNGTSTIDEQHTNGNSSSTNGVHVQSQGHLLTRQALHTYETANHVIRYKYNSYSGTLHDLPK